jgi:hypothetical protein
VVASEEKVNELKDRIRSQGNSIADFKNGLKKNENGIKDMNRQFDDLQAKMASVFGNTGNLQVFVQQYETDKVNTAD